MKILEAFMKRFIWVLCGLALVMSGVYAASDDPVEDAIEARRAYMKLNGFNISGLAAMAKGEVEYDAELAATFANNLHLLTSMKNPTMWPEGSDNKAYAGDTRALPEIWSNYSELVEINQKFAKAVAELAEVAGNGLDQVREKLGPVGEGCKSCHEGFRAEDF